MKLTIVRTEVAGVVIIEPQIFADPRGYFFESYNQQDFDSAVGPMRFVQDNESLSTHGVLRGLHYQLPPFAQAKLIRAVRGRIFDVAVDIRRGSPTFGKHVAVELSGENKRQLFISRGLAHGFVVLSEQATCAYKADNYYSRTHERGIRFDDVTLGIDWPLAPEHLIFSQRDRALPSLVEADLPELEP